MNRSVSSPIGLRHLRAFVVTCDERHVGRAADRLGLTQPAISKTLTELEELTGEQLVQRDRRGARPTARGEALLPRARAALDAVEAAGAALAGHETGSGSLCLGILPTVAAAIVPKAHARFRAAHPGVGLQIVTRTNTELLTLLRSRDVDIVVGRMSEPAATVGLTFELLFLDGLSLATRHGHPLGNGATPSMSVVLEYPVVVALQGTVPRRNTETLLAAHGRAVPSSAVETLDVAVATGICLASDAVWITPTSTLASTTGLVELSVHGPEPASIVEPVGLFRRTDTAASPELETLVESLRHAADRKRDRRTEANRTV